MTLRIRSLELADIDPLGAALERAYAGGQDFRTRLRGYLGRTDVVPFVAERHGAPIGFVAGIDYGRYAYVALMGVDPAAQRSGAGTALMEELCTWADVRGFRGVELDATDAGAPLYERCGFHDAGITAVYTREGPGAPAAASGVRLADVTDREALLAYDRIAFGADRSAVLEALLAQPEERAFIADGDGFAGYVVAQPATNQIGPLVAHDANVAASLLDCAAAMMRTPHRVSVLRETSAAEELLRARGYVYARSLRHMVRGGLPPGARERLFARINLGQG